MAGFDFTAALGFSKPAHNLEGIGNYHMASNVDTEPLKKKDNPADPNSLAARLASGNIDGSFA